MNILSITGIVLFSAPARSKTSLLEKAVAAGANLTRAYLVGANLRVAYLARADLTRADLTGANLAGADLAGANLRGADLAGANLAGANLREVALTGAYLVGADLTRADLTGANLAGAYLRGANLREADLAGADLAGADLVGANLARAELTRANLTDTIGMVKVMGVEPGNVYWKRFDHDLNNNGFQFKVGINTLREGEIFAADDRVMCSYPAFHFASRSWCAVNYPHRPLEARIRIPDDAQINEPWATDGKASADKIEILQVLDTKTGEDVTDKFRRQ